MSMKTMTLSVDFFDILLGEHISTFQYTSQEACRLILHESFLHRYRGKHRFYNFLQYKSHTNYCHEKGKDIV